MSDFLTKSENNCWRWKNWDVSWSVEGIGIQSPISVVLIHGFGACKEHWRYNQPELAKLTPCFAIDLIGFGKSSQPQARLKNEPAKEGDFAYNFDNWGAQVADFCREVVKKPVLLIGNSIGGVIALRASQLLQEEVCCGVVLIACATRALDDKRLSTQPNLMRWTRPWLKKLVSQRWLSINLFRNAASPGVIKRVLEQAYPSGANVDENLLKILQKPSQRPGAPEAFHGFINLFDDYLAPSLMTKLKIPVDLIWGEADPWEPLSEARQWQSSLQCIRSLEIINGAGHCPHDEAPEQVNPLIIKVIQQAI